MTHERPCKPKWCHHLELRNENHHPKSPCFCVWGNWSGVVFKRCCPTPLMFPKLKGAFLTFIWWVIHNWPQGQKQNTFDIKELWPSSSSSSSTTTTTINIQLVRRPPQISANHHLQSNLGSPCFGSEARVVFNLWQRRWSNPNWTE